VISVEFARRAREELQAGELSIEYLESSAGHWVPPELLPRAREFVAAAVAGILEPD
jgi:hypothetical protein